MILSGLFLLFFFNDTATTEIYTLSLHDALPISLPSQPPRPDDARGCLRAAPGRWGRRCVLAGPPGDADRSEEHTSELQSQSNLVCRLLLEKKNTNGGSQGHGGATAAVVACVR